MKVLLENGKPRQCALGDIGDYNSLRVFGLDGTIFLRGPPCDGDIKHFWCARLCEGDIGSDGNHQAWYKIACERMVQPLDDEDVVLTIIKRD
jgi:hypothetical protein